MDKIIQLRRGQGHSGCIQRQRPLKESTKTLFLRMGAGIRTPDKLLACASFRRPSCSLEKSGSIESTEPFLCFFVLPDSAESFSR
jgi:hypothetical protein